MKKTEVKLEAGCDAMERQFPSARRSELLRFLKARRGNVAEASSQYEQHLAWRAETLPVPYEDVSAVLQSGVIYELPGPAHDGSSVLVFHGPKHDPKRFATAETLAAIVHVATTAFGKRGDPDDMRFTLILFAPKGTPFDLSGIAALASVMSQNFPETMTSTVVFPCGRFTSMLWKMAKHFLDPRTAAKVRLLVDGGKCPTQLGEIVPVDFLPPEFLPREEREKRKRSRKPRSPPPPPGASSRKVEGGGRRRRRRRRRREFLLWTDKEKGQLPHFSLLAHFFCAGRLRCSQICTSRVL